MQTLLRRTHMTKTEALAAALAFFDGSPTALARAIGGGVQRQNIEHWMKLESGVPVPHCAAVEQATGGAVTRRQLQPDVWHRVWPELVTAEFPAPEPTPAADAKAAA
jgi:DNA-binding transcriptional regulator YdaS (Cro superfamily)